MSQAGMRVKAERGIGACTPQRLGSGNKNRSSRILSLVAIHAVVNFKPHWMAAKRPQRNAADHLGKLKD
jgi:hypothetical protein